MPIWTGQPKDSTSWGNASLDASTFTGQTKTIDGFILLENGAYLLQENGGRFILEQAYDAGWITQSES